MTSIDGDFEKGEKDGSRDALDHISSVAKLWLETTASAVLAPLADQPVETSTES